MRSALSKICSLDALKSLVADAQSAGKRVVFANGCFDTLHVGHVRYLDGAKEQGDLLVVGVNSDSSVTQLKGPGRPILDEQARAQLVASLRSVDFVILFPDPNVERLLEVASSRRSRQGHGLHRRHRPRTRRSATPRHPRRHRRRP